jgi:hypothetical protein
MEQISLLVLILFLILTVVVFCRKVAAKISWLPQKVHQLLGNILIAVFCVLLIVSAFAPFV